MRGSGGRPPGLHRAAPHEPPGVRSPPMKVAVVKETAPAERRVALVPEAIAKLRSAGHEVLVERGAGEAAFFPDDAFADAGATIVSADQIATADAVLMVGKPD